MIGEFTLGYEGYGNDFAKTMQLSVLQKSILHIALALRKKHYNFDMFTLFEQCCKKLPNPEPEIDRAIRDLYEMKFFVKGKRLFKIEILKNTKRKQIYEYVLTHPGAHEREIRKSFTLGAYETRIHLAFLVTYDFLQFKSYKNRNTYFPIDFDETLELETLLLRNDTTKAVLESIRTQGQIRLSEIADAIQKPYTTIQSHLKELIEHGRVKKIQKDQIAYYTIDETMPPPPPETPAQKEVMVKREFDYVGGKIRFKVAIRNYTNLAIHNISINLNPSDQFIADLPQQIISNLSPNSTRGIDFDLTPLTCGQSKVFGSVSFEDAHGKAHSITIQPKEISIKCPLVSPLNATQSEVNGWIKNLKRGTMKIQYQNIPDSEAFRVGREQVSALDLNEINVNSEEMYGLFSGKVKVTGKNTVVKLSLENQNIILDVWAQDLKQTTGFLAYITNLINIALEVSYKMVRKTEDSMKKVMGLSKMSEYVDEIIELCQNRAPIHRFSTTLSTIEQGLLQTVPDSVLVNSIQVWDSKLKSHFDSHDSIEKSIAIELQYKAILWLYKIRDLMQTHMKMYQDTFDDFNQFSQEISSGLNFISQKIAQHEKDYGIGILSYLLIADQKSGICLFELNLGDIKINPDLVGGFLHALQSFGLEISDSETSMKTLSYQNYQFQIETGEYSRVALILRGEPNKFLRSKLKTFVKQFELDFKEDIINFTGNMDVFKPVGKLFNDIFE